MNVFDHVPLPTIISMLGLDMQDKGNYYLGRCCFHLDDHPSFSIRKSDGVFTCFKGCATGSINKLIYLLTGKGAYKFLNINSDINSFYFEKSMQKRINKNRTAFKSPNTIDIIGNLQSIYDNEEAYTFLKFKQVSNKFIDDFNIKCCVNAEINKTTFRNRIVIPIIENGIVIGYEGRDFTGRQKPKVLYHNGCNVSSLFNIDNLDVTKELIIVEGMLKLSQIYTEISSNSTHTFGAKITNTQKIQINRFKKLIVFIDNDSAGENVLNQFSNFYENEFYIVKSKIEGQDAADMTIEEIREAFDSKVLSINYFLNKSKLFETKKIEW